ncbi:hypothetical protein L228DRAFT_264222 [Xylona heveae TC161]|uniref:FAM192A/Fyv6 N-terminal domain-containing protein n=1 Tax=Xylona heveae (strain CBS 132557 / TC161) TaxID=1328760 RepID=A0A164Z9B8_XYLHT|nr:hypothetical protein L228DRAFT_264222 [Xylona heveae TC161]KZF18841.1 hypothetical protein L228DRAFT_264222 [Xylona heveae TC161]
MSSGFVSGGTNEQPIERDDAWLEAQQQIEETRRRKEEEGKQDGGKSLFETLQANKAAKQDAFEESIKLKHQFRSLDEDEVEFLDSVLESTRAQEAALKKETSEQLDYFRKQQEQADKALLAAEGEQDAQTGAGSGSPTATAEEENWAVSGRKRKKGKDGQGGLRGVKLLRKSSSASGANEKQKNAASPGSDSPDTKGVSSAAKPAQQGGEKPTATEKDEKDEQHKANAKKELNGTTPPVSSADAKANGTVPSQDKQNSPSKPVSGPTKAPAPATSGSSLGLQLGAYDSDED